jgi:hypothetical protein
VATVKEKIVESVRSSASYNSAAESKPACILWTDKEELWLPSIHSLREALPELLTLGGIDRDSRTGPGIWIRCAIAGRLEEFVCPAGNVPVVYVPGFCRQDLRPSDDCPDALKPLVELQYRSVFWSRSNSKDWTVYSYFSEAEGLGLNLPDTPENRARVMERLHMSLPELLEMEESEVAKKAENLLNYIKTIVLEDPVKAVLSWLGNKEDFIREANGDQWRAFAEHCRDNLEFDPELHAPEAVSEKLARHEGEWGKVWRRFCEAPGNEIYLGVHGLLEKLPSPKTAKKSPIPDGFPKWNAEREKDLRAALTKLRVSQPDFARDAIIKLELAHSPRREFPWAGVGKAPLAKALEHLAAAASASRDCPVNGGGVKDLEDGYVGGGWKVDDGVARAFAELSTSSDRDALSWAVRSFYIDWLRGSARRLQELAETAAYPGDRPYVDAVQDYEPGDCILFVDGLRFDVAKSLSAVLRDGGFLVTEEPVWGALPSVTATGKYAVSPVRGLITGKDSADFQPVIRESGRELDSKSHASLLQREGWTVIKELIDFDGLGKGWHEYGNIDHDGHHYFAPEFASKLKEHTQAIGVRVEELFERGWIRVFVVTDHGWLSMPKSLEKAAPPPGVTVKLSGRCASVTPGAQIEHRKLAWHWNPDQFYVYPDGVCSFTANQEYAHGGLSLQECLTLRLVATKPAGSATGEAIVITSHEWSRSNCLVRVTGDASGLSLDIRESRDDPGSSLVLKDENTVFRAPEGDRKLWMAKAPCETWDKGKEAFLVVVDGNGIIVTSAQTVIEG